MTQKYIIFSAIFVLLPATVLSQQCNARISPLGCVYTGRSGNNNRMCYHVVVDSLTWINSRQQCECRGWQLAKIQTAAIQAVLPSRSRDVWVDAKMEEFSWWFWLTGTEFLDNVDGTEKCGYLDLRANLRNSDFQLKGELCGQQYRYMCRNSSCTSTSNRFNTDCFTISSETTSWHQARKKCEDAGLQFAYRDDTTQEKLYTWNEIFQFAQNTTVERLWVGARKAEWMWQGPPREHFIYPNFASGTNAAGTNLNRCLTLRSDGFWFAQDCNLPVWGLCESAYTNQSEPVKVRASHGRGNELPLNEQGNVICDHTGIPAASVALSLITPSGEFLLYNSSTGLTSRWQQRVTINRNADVTEATIGNVNTDDSGVYVCKIMDNFGHITEGNASVKVIDLTSTGQTTNPTSQLTPSTEASTTSEGAKVTSSQLTTPTLPPDTTRPNLRTTSRVTVKETTTTTIATETTTISAATSTNNGDNNSGNNGNTNNGNNNGQQTTDYSKTTTTVATTTEPACQSNPCGNGGACTPDGSSYKCMCTPCYTGANCETRFQDPCSSGPCRNGGICSGTCTNYTCSCTSNFYGSNCQFACDNIVAVTPSRRVLLGQPTWLYCTPRSATTTIQWKSPSNSFLTLDRNLTLTNLHTSDAGTYTCEVSSNLCTSKMSATVTTYFEITPNKTGSQQIRGTVGEFYSLNCSATGNPTPYLYWVFTRAGTEPASIGNSQTANQNNLRLFNVQENSEGLYECKASIAGEDLATVESVVFTVPKNNNTGGNNSGNNTGNPTSGASTSGENSWKWWQVLIVVVIVLLLIIIIIVVIIAVVRKLNSDDSRVSPENAEKSKHYDSEIYIPPGAKVPSFDSRPPPVEENSKPDEDYKKYSRLNKFKLMDTTESGYDTNGNSTTEGDTYPFKISLGSSTGADAIPEENAYRKKKHRSSSRHRRSKAEEGDTNGNTTEGTTSNSGNIPYVDSGSTTEEKQNNLVNENFQEDKKENDVKEQNDDKKSSSRKRRSRKHHRKNPDDDRDTVILSLPSNE